MTDEEVCDVDPDVMLTEYREAEEDTRLTLELLNADFNLLCAIYIEHWSEHLEYQIGRLVEWLEAHDRAVTPLWIETQQRRLAYKRAQRDSARLNAAQEAK